MAADGSVIIGVKMNTTQADKDLAKLKKEIEATEDTIGEQETKKSPLTAQAEKLNQEMRKARAEVQKFGQQWAAGVAGADGQQARAQERLNQIQTEYEGVVQQIDKIDAKLLPAYEKLDRMKEQAGALQQNINQAAKNTRKMEKATKKADKHMGLFATRLRGILLSAFVFNILSAGFRELTDWTGNVIKSNDEARASIAKLKGALLTLAQPLVEVVIPAFIFLVNVLTRVISAIAQMFAMLSGTSVEASKEAAEALNEQTKALDGTGDAAKDASKSLAGFDEINKLSSGTADAAQSEVIAPDFSFEADLSDDQLQNILGLVTAIGAGFLAWKISSALGMGLSGIVGIALTIYSVIGFVKGMFDAWNNGVTTENIQRMLMGVLGAVVGLGIAFGPVGAGIALLVGGLAMLITGFHDAMETGWNFENTLLTIAGILAAGMGIALLTGSWIPLLIAAIAGVLLAITVAFGEGENLIAGAKRLLGGFVDFIAGVFSGDIDRAIRGVGDIFGGLGDIINSILNALSNMINSFFDWLEEKTGLSFESARLWLLNLVTTIQELIGGAIAFLQGAFQGLILFFSGVFTGDWDNAWQGIIEIGKSAINLLISMVEAFVNFFVRALNAVISALNSIQVSIPDWVPVLGGRTFGINLPAIKELKLPRLAEGAVIPPNREFMAVLGDQKSGTNIETPLATMVQAFRMAMQDMGGGQSEAVMVVDDEVFARLVYKMNNKEGKRIGVSLAGGGV